MINRNVELREMDLGDVGSTNWSNQTISKGMASKTSFRTNKISVRSKTTFINLAKVQVGQDCGQVNFGLTFTLTCKFSQIIPIRPS